MISEKDGIFNKWYRRIMDSFVGFSILITYIWPQALRLLPADGVNGILLTSPRLFD